MNGLTTEDLQIILFWGIDRIEGVGINNFTEEGHLELFHKLQEMLDNYCEHEIKALGINENGHIFTKCTNCDKELWHEKD
jgi:hypothetical protein